MSAVIAAPAAGDTPVRRGKKKLFVIAAAVLAVLLAGGAGAVVYLKQKAAHAAAGDDEAGGGEHAQAGKADAKNAPVYLPLDPFVVNLADKETDRYAQVGLTFELDNGVSADQIKAYMPAIRNAVLMILAHKTSHELLDRSGKEQLAQEIMREAVRPMGIDIAAPSAVTPVLVAVVAAAASAASDRSAASAAPAAGPATSATASADDPAPAKTAAVARRKNDGPRNPIQHVHFSSFIIQ